MVRKLFKQGGIGFGMEWKEWEGKKNVFIKLKDGSVYSNCEIIDYDEELNFLKFIDKFGNEVVVLISEIIKIIKEKNENNRELD